MVTHEEYIRHYTWLHAQGMYGRYPSDTARAEEVARYLLQHMTVGQTAIDCSCGRGLLMRMLSAAGIVCEGTEADASLIDAGVACGPVRHLFYHQLSTLQPQKWDVVISIDVLEHLFTEEEVRTALRDLAALSRKMLAVTVGLTPSHWECENGETVTLHHVVRPGDWWASEVSAVARVCKSYEFRRSQVIFAEVHQ